MEKKQRSKRSKQRTQQGLEWPENKQLHIATPWLAKRIGRKPTEAETRTYVDALCQYANIILRAEFYEKD